jgi:hypothetical protein
MSFINKNPQMCLQEQAAKNGYELDWNVVRLCISELQRRRDAGLPPPAETDARAVAATAGAESAVSEQAASLMAADRKREAGDDVGGLGGHDSKRFKSGK